ncbi:MAG: hypothetical protein ABIT38_06885 [Gemmatimonadaceae bacterium]
MTRYDSQSNERTGRDGGVARIVCISTDVDASAALQALVATLIPDARVEAADTSILRGVPIADCAILSVGSMYSMAMSLVHELRGRGFAGSIILIADSVVALQDLELSRYGVDATFSYATLPSTLPDAVAEIAARQAKTLASTQGPALLAALHRTQGLLAAGAIASSLQHRLNNPLAALLAEAQLLELESLDPEHASSVRRIVHLCRRVIEVSRSIDGVGLMASNDGIDGSEEEHSASSVTS